MSFICYKMTHDSGFAPNPFFDVLTLATCKPAIRRTKKPGDWVAGFVSKALVNKSKSETVKYQGLIYLMKIGEVLTLDDYFKDPRFVKKKPIKNHPDPVKRSGDNIYYLFDGNYCQLPNNSHNPAPEDCKHDTNGENVLIADMNESYYFGRNCQIPEGGWEKVGLDFSKGRTFYRDADSDLKNICNYLLAQGFAPGIHGNPSLQVEREDSSTHGGGCSRQ